MRIEAYIPCRNEQYRLRLENVGKTWLDIPVRALCGYHSFCQIITDAIEQSEADYLLFLHDDLAFPRDFESQIFRLIAQLNRERPNWGLAGNCGIIGESCVYFVQDPVVLKPRLSNYPHRCAFVDGNAMLLNRCAFVDSHARLPVFDGFHGYDMFLSLGCLEKGLGVYAASELYVKHLSEGDRNAFIDFIQRNEVQSELRNRLKERSFLPIAHWVVVQDSEVGIRNPDERPTILDLVKRSALECRHTIPTSVCFCFGLRSTACLASIFNNLEQIQKEGMSFDWSVRIAVCGTISDSEKRRIMDAYSLPNVEWIWIPDIEWNAERCFDDCRFVYQLFNRWLADNPAIYCWFGWEDAQINVSVLSLFGLILDEQGRSCVFGSWNCNTYPNPEFLQWRVPQLSEGLFPTSVVRTWLAGLVRERFLRTAQAELTPERSASLYKVSGVVGTLWIVALMSGEYELVSRPESLGKSSASFSVPCSDKLEWERNYCRYRQILGPNIWNCFSEVDDRKRRWKLWLKNCMLMRIVRFVWRKAGL